jgi:hypothetical protein
VSAISSKYGWVAIGIQDELGTPVATTVKIPLAARPSLHGKKNRERYERTDGDRGPGPGYTSEILVSGGIEIEVHPDWMHTVFAWAFGENATSGAGADKTHVATPGSATLFATIERGVGNVIYERFWDVKVNTINLTGASKGYYRCALDLLGLNFEKKTAGTVSALDMLRTKGLLYAESKNLLKIETVARRLKSWEFGLGNNAEIDQAEDYFGFDVLDGDLDPTCKFLVNFEGPDAEPVAYNEFFFGAGTTPTPDVATKALNFGIERAANSSIFLATPQVTYTTFEIQPDPSGQRIEIEMETSVEIPDDGSPIVTATTKNQVATI